MKLTVNGEVYQHGGEGSLVSLLAGMDVAAERVAVMVNDEVVAKADRESAELKEGDRVEILTFAQGG